jgi:hypothetical protein
MARYPTLPTFAVRPADFERLLNSSNVTYRAIHRRADLCPCFDSARGSPEYTCPACGGIGRAWTTPPASAYTDTLVLGSVRVPERVSRALVAPGSITAAYVNASGATVTVSGITLDEIGTPTWPTGTTPPIGTTYTVTYTAPQQGRVHAQSITKTRELADRGMVVAGSMDISVPRYYDDLTTPNPAWQAAEHDRFAFPDLKHRHQARLQRGRNERLTYALVRDIRDVRAIVDGALAHYDPAASITVNAAGTVTWVAPDALPAGTPYVVDYIAAPEYYVWQELPQQRHIDGHDLPRRVSLRLFEQYPNRA